MMLLADEWGINGKKTFVFLLTSLMISLLVILLLTVAIIANICIRAFANDQPGQLSYISLPTCLIYTCNFSLIDALPTRRTTALTQ